MPLILLIFFFSTVGHPQAEEFAGEAYLLGMSVLTNGSAGTLASKAQSPSQFVEFPAMTPNGKWRGLEVATLPTFDNLVEVFTGSSHFSVDSVSHLQALFVNQRIEGIPEKPILAGTPEQRESFPIFRPQECTTCVEFTDQTNLFYLNFLRSFPMWFPRNDISQRPIPMTLSVASTMKYFWETLEGDSYIAQNLNMDIGVSLNILWGYSPQSKSSKRNFTLQASLLEALGTAQTSTFSGPEVKEPIPRRWRVGWDWEEGITRWKSTFKWALIHKSESQSHLGWGSEWAWDEKMYLRGGWDGDRWALGASVIYHSLGVHYAFSRHPLGWTAYQISLEWRWL